MDRSIELNGHILSLPTELLVNILSFLRNVRDIAKIQYVSRRFRSVSRETPSLWREFVWPNLDSNEERCVKSVLKSCGQYMMKLSFPDHVMPSKLTYLLLHCSNLVQLSIPTSQLSPDQLIKVMKSAERLQGLDIQWTNHICPLLEICSGLNELTIRIVVRLALEVGLDLWLKKWMTNGYHPQTLKVISQNIPVKELVKHWYLLNPYSPSGCTGCLKIYNSLKVPMDLFPALPDFQLQFGESCVLPFVKPSKCGLLGLEEEDVFVTDSVCHGKALHKAVMLRLNDDIERSRFKSNVTSLSCVTQFDTTRCDLYPGHLEQLAAACPNLQHLNLLGNRHCLERLQGLRVLSSSCKNIRGLTLVEISNVEDCVQLWEILADMRLTYLGIELVVLLPWIFEINKIISLFQQCIDLKAIEVQRTRFGYKHISHNLSVLSNFPSLIYCFVGNIPFNIEAIVNSCLKLKYFVHSSYSSEFLNQSVAENDGLEQLCIKSAEPRDAVVPDTFLESVSAHGRLVHVALCVGTLYTDGITALIENSPKLLTCYLYTARVMDSDNNEVIPLTDMKMMLKRKFANRKLFTCGSFNLRRSKADRLFVDIANLLIQRQTDIFSLWSTDWDTVFRILEYPLL